MSKIDHPTTSTVQMPEQTVDTKDPSLRPRTNEEPFIEAQQTSLSERTSTAKTTAERLFDALERNDMDEFEHMLNPHTLHELNMADIIWAQNKNGQTLLHLAVAKQNVTALLILQNAYPYPIRNIKNRKKETVDRFISKQSESFKINLKTAEEKQKKENLVNLFKAVESQNQTLLRFYMKRVDPQIIQRARKAGETLGHIAVLNQNIPAILALKEASQSPLGDIKNAKGETIDDYIEKQGIKFQEKLEAAEVERAKGLGFHQGTLIKKAARFLQIRADEMKKSGLKENDPKLEHIKDLENIINDLLDGHCQGFSLAWAEMFVVNLERQYSEGLTLLKDWDGRQENVTPALTDMMDDLFQRILFYQGNTGVQQILRPDSSDAFLPRKQEAPLKTFIDNPRYLFPIEYLEIKTHLIHSNILDSLITEGNVMLISGGGHVIAVGQKNGIYYLHDANYTGFEADFDSEKGAVKFDSLSELSKNIYSQLFQNEENQSGSFNYTLSIIDLKENNHSYPTKKDVEDYTYILDVLGDQSLKYYEQIGKIIDHKIDYFTYPDIELLISQMSLEDINKPYLGLTVLSQFLAKPNYPHQKEVIKMLLERGAEPTYNDVGGDLGFAMYQKNDPEIIQMIYEKNPEQEEFLSPEFKKKLQEILGS